MKDKNYKYNRKLSKQINDNKQNQYGEINLFFALHEVLCFIP